MGCGIRIRKFATPSLSRPPRIRIAPTEGMSRESPSCSNPQPPTVTPITWVAAYKPPSSVRITTYSVPLPAMRMRVLTKGAVPEGIVNQAATGLGLLSTSSKISRAPCNVLDTVTGTLAPLSAMDGALIVISELDTGRPPSAAMDAAKVSATNVSARSTPAAAFAMLCPSVQRKTIAAAPCSRRLRCAKGAR